MKIRRTLIIIAGSILAVAVLFVAFLPTIFQALGLHPEWHGPTFSVKDGRALVITTSHGVLSRPGETDGRDTGVLASEMTHPYYVFLDAGMDVDVASVLGGEIPIDPVSFAYPIISAEDRRFQKDPVFQAKVQNSIRIDDIDFAEYDVVFLAGGWGAAYDLAQSEVLAEKIADAYYSERETIIGSVCHGALGLVSAEDRDGNPLVAGRRITGVTNRQLDALNIKFTPKHPETELIRAGAIFESTTAFNDFFATHVTVDDEERFVTGQNQNSGLEASHKITELLAKR
jgi:putative intracellular protease/amidase